MEYGVAGYRLVVAALGAASHKLGLTFKVFGIAAFGTVIAIAPF